MTSKVTIPFGRFNVEVSEVFHQALIEWGGAVPGSSDVRLDEGELRRVARRSLVTSEVSEKDGLLLLGSYGFGLSSERLCEIVGVDVAAGAVMFARALNALGDDTSGRLAVVLDASTGGPICPE